METDNNRGDEKEANSDPRLEKPNLEAKKAERRNTKGEGGKQKSWEDGIIEPLTVMR